MAFDYAAMERELEGHVPAGMEGESLATRLFESGLWDDVIGPLSEADKLELAYDRRFLSRPAQLIDPLIPARRIVCDAGRGFGKTFTGVQWCRMLVYEQGVTELAIVGQSMRDVRHVMAKEFLKVLPPEQRPDVRLHVAEIEFPPGGNCPEGCTAIVFYGDSVEQARGGNFQAAWIDEIAKFQYPEQLMTTLAPMVRTRRPDGGKAQILFTTTPRPIPTLQRYHKRRKAGDPGVHFISGTSYENARNLDPGTIEEWVQEMGGTETRMYRQEILGEMLEINENALWSVEWFKGFDPPHEEDAAGEPLRHRGGIVVDVEATKAMFAEITVNIDPSGNFDRRSSGDKCGLTVTGRLPGKVNTATGVVIDDLTLNCSPNEWAAMACELFYKWDATFCIGELNFGNGMVPDLIKANDPHGAVRFKGIRVNANKPARAAAVAGLYEAGRILHLQKEGLRGMQPMAQMEDEMLMFAPEEYLGEGSPDRTDATVLGFRYLFGLGDPKTSKAGPVPTRRRRR